MLLQLFPDSVLLSPPSQNRLVWIAWEFLYPILLLLTVRNSVLIFANTRINPLAHYIKTSNRLICVLHDFMDTNLESFRTDSAPFAISRSNLLLSFNTYLISSSLNSADTVITNSHLTNQSLLSALPTLSPKSFVLYPHLSFSPISLASSLRQLCDDPTNIPVLNTKYSSILLSVTGVSANKSPHSYVELIRQLSVRTSQKTLYYLVGMPPDSTFIKSINIESPNLKIIPIPRVSEHTLISFYLLSDTFISLSTDEGFGIPLLDALSFGIPSRVTSIPSFCEISDLFPQSDITLYSPHLITKELTHSLAHQTNTDDRYHRFALRAEAYLEAYQRHATHLQNQAQRVLASV